MRGQLQPHKHQTPHGVTDFIKYYISILTITLNHKIQGFKKENPGRPKWSQLWVLEKVDRIFIMEGYIVFVGFNEDFV